MTLHRIININQMKHSVTVFRFVNGTAQIAIPIKVQSGYVISGLRSTGTRQYYIIMFVAQNYDITSIIGSFEDSKAGSDSAFPAPSWRRGKSSTQQSTRVGAGNTDSLPHEVRLERDVGVSLLLNVLHSS